MTDTSIDPKGIGERIRALRKKYNKTQSYFADLLFISPSYLALIEGGQRTPSLDIVARLSKYCGVSADYILFGEESKSSDMNRRKFEVLCERHTPEEVTLALRMAEYYLELKKDEAELNPA
ncbi:MAG: helix-turn-helix domain-containing protein [Lachnospiraceae bacterium]|nr:helix-turn-helix domain-containing protein [Lachnospiraceae bacterium]